MNQKPLTAHKYLNKAEMYIQMIRKSENDNNFDD